LIKPISCIVLAQLFNFNELKILRHPGPNQLLFLVTTILCFILASNAVFDK